MSLSFYPHIPHRATLDEKDMVSVFSYVIQWKSTRNSFGAHRRSRLTTTEAVVFLFSLQMQATKDPVGTCYLKKEQLCGLRLGRKKIHSELWLTTKNKTTKALLRFCVRVSRLLAYSFDSALRRDIYNRGHTPAFKFQRSHKGICLAQTQNPITTAIISIL